jgi:hypothetical protein
MLFFFALAAFGLVWAKELERRSNPYGVFDSRWPAVGRCLALAVSLPLLWTRVLLGPALPWAALLATPVLYALRSALAQALALRTRLQWQLAGWSMERGDSPRLRPLELAEAVGGLAASALAIWNACDPRFDWL